ncbi:MAG: MBL fold metallo-hydrolase [Deltaproteobacteria bacterium]|nr:MBL fold metallo-hydrolase [Deltaproteobacteria bacterium]
MSGDSWRVLGSGTLEFLPGRNPSAHLLTVAGHRVLVDTGPGTIPALAGLQLTTRDLAAIVHSHLHLDHLGDLFALWFHHRIARGDRAPLLFAGAPGHEARLRRVADALDPKLLLAPIDYLEQPPDGSGRVLGDVPITARAWPAAHTQSPRVLRFEGAGWTVAYSGDSGPCAGLVEAARGVDWLVIECSTPDDAPRLRHLTPSQVAEVVVQAQPKGVALVHLSPLWAHPVDAADAVRSAVGGRWGGTLLGAYDGLELPLPYSHSMVPGGLLEMS